MEHTLVVVHDCVPRLEANTTAATRIVHAFGKSAQHPVVLTGDLWRNIERTQRPLVEPGAGNLTIAVDQNDGPTS